MHVEKALKFQTLITPQDHALAQRHAGSDSDDGVDPRLVPAVPALHLQIINASVLSSSLRSATFISPCKIWTTVWSPARFGLGAMLGPSPGTGATPTQRWLSTHTISKYQKPQVIGW